MNVWPKKLLSLLLAAAMCWSLLPADILAGDSGTAAADPSVEKLTATVNSLEGADSITITTASAFSHDGSKAQIYLEIAGLPETRHFVRVKATSGSTTVSSSASKLGGEDLTGFTITLSAAAGQYTVDVLVCSSNNDTSALYEAASFTITLAAFAPLTLEQVLEYGGQQSASVARLNFSVPAYFPENAIASGAVLSAKLLDDSGNAVAATLDKNKPSLSTSYFADHRYAFFETNANINRKAQSTSFQLYAGEQIEAGVYDLQIFADGVQYAIFADYVLCSDLPVVEINGYSEFAPLSKAGDTVAGGALTLYNGDPEDFALELWRGETKLGASDRYRIQSTYSGRGLLVNYWIPLDTALESGAEYVLRVANRKGSAFFGDTEYAFTGNDFTTMRTGTIHFSNAFYANLLLGAAGVSPSVEYRAELSLNGMLLSTVFVSPDENGIFDIEFTDENGDPIALQSNSRYHIALSQPSNDSWSSLAGVYVQSPYVSSALSLLSAEEDATVSLNATSASVLSAQNGQFRVNVSGSKGFLDGWTSENFALKLYSVTGQEMTLPLSSGTLNTAGTSLTLWYDVPETLPVANYWCDLLYDGALVLKASTGANLLTPSSPITNSTEPAASAVNTTVDGRYAANKLSVNNLEGKAVTMELYAFGNLTAQPDHTVVLTAADDYAIAEDALKPRYLAQPYQTVYFVDGQYVGTSSQTFNFWITAAQQQTMRQDTYTVTQDASLKNGTLEFLTPLGSNEDGTYPALRQIYVKAAPAAGYRLKPGSVTINGMSIYGRAFQLTEDAVISATFEKAEGAEVSYDVNTQWYIPMEDGDTRLDASAASTAQPGDTVTVDLSGYAAYLVDSIVCYYDDGSYANKVTVTETAGGTWTFVMPESDVLVEVCLKMPETAEKEYTITASPVGGGKLTVPTSAKAGETVSLTVEPSSDYELFALEVIYRDENGEKVVIDPYFTDSPNPYFFTMPAADVTVEVVFATGDAIYNVHFHKDSYGYGSVYGYYPQYYPGMTAKLFIQPSEGFRVVEDTLAVYDENNVAYPLTQNADGDWTFIMPECDVYLYAEFEYAPPSAPGGKVTDPSGLQAALGGEALSQLESGTVRLLNDVELASMLELAGGTMTLDLNGFSLTGAARTGDGETAVIKVSQGADFTLTNSHSNYISVIRPGGSRQDAYHGVWVSGGKFTLANGYGSMQLYGGSTQWQNGAAAVLVSGGEAHIGNRDYAGDLLDLYGQNRGEGLRVIGGNAYVYGGRFYGGYGSELTNPQGGDGIRVSGSGSLQMAGGTANGGSSGVGLHIGLAGTDTTGAIRLNGGSYCADNGTVAIQVEGNVSDLVISAGFVDCGMYYAVKLPAGKTLRDYLAKNSMVINAYTNTALTEAELAVSEIANIALRIESGYAVTFLDHNGNTLQVQQVAANQYAYDPGAVREGYALMGWYTDPACKNRFDFGIPITADCTLYPGWGRALVLAKGLAGAAEIAVNGIVQKGDSAFAARPGDSVRVTVRGTYARPDLRGTGGGESWSVTMSRNAAGDWTGTFLMPDASVTLSADLTPDAAMQTTTAVVLLEPANGDSIASVTVSGEGYHTLVKADEPGLAKQAIKVPASGSFTLEVWTANGLRFVVDDASAADGSTFPFAVPKETYQVSGEVAFAPNGSLPAGETDLWLDVYDSDNTYVTFAKVDLKKNTFAAAGLANGTYQLVARGSANSYAAENASFTVNGGNVALGTAVTVKVGRSLTVNTEEPTGSAAAQGYLVLEQQVDDAWQFVASQKGSGTYVFENALMDAGNYRVRLEALYDAYGAGLAFTSEPVAFTDSTVPVTVAYKLPVDTENAFSGEGNLVTLNRTEAYPGDYLDLTIHFDGGGIVPESFRLTLPEGIEGEATIAAGKYAKNPLHVMLQVSGTAQHKLHTIPVQVEANGNTVDFGTVAVNVGQPTLTAPAMAAAKVPFTVSGEAAPGSTVTIRELDSGMALATLTTTGRNFSSRLTLPVGEYRLVAEVRTDSGAVYSETASVKVDGAPLSVSVVRYGADKAAAVWDALRETFLFHQFVDMDLRGGELPVLVQLANADQYEITEAALHFCGTNVSAKYDKDAQGYAAVFAAESWGGSGMKPLTATVTLKDGTKLEMLVAYVNLLVDPSGQVTDENGKPLSGVTVVCQILDENGTWVNWDAAASKQVNPQVTDTDGRYGWCVDPGVYRVLAYKEGYEDYDSLTQYGDNVGGSTIVIPPARNDIDFTMKKLKVELDIESVSTEGKVSVKLENLDRDAILMVAYYEQSGRMAGVAMQNVKAAATESTLEVTLADGATPAYAKAFLLAADSKAPLLESKEMNI